MVWTSAASGGTIVYTTSAAHTFTAGSVVDFTEFAPAGYNKTGATIASVTSNTDHRDRNRANPGAMTVKGVVTGALV